MAWQHRVRDLIEFADLCTRALLHPECQARLSVGLAHRAKPALIDRHTTNPSKSRLSVPLAARCCYWPLLRAIKVEGVLARQLDDPVARLEVLQADHARLAWLLRRCASNYNGSRCRRCSVDDTRIDEPKATSIAQATPPLTKRAPRASQADHDATDNGANNINGVVADVHNYRQGACRDYKLSIACARMLRCMANARRSKGQYGTWTGDENKDSRTHEMRIIQHIDGCLPRELRSNKHSQA